MATYASTKGVWSGILPPGTSLTLVSADSTDTLALTLDNSGNLTMVDDAAATILTLTADKILTVTDGIKSDDFQSATAGATAGVWGNDTDAASSVGVAFGNVAELASGTDRYIAQFYRDYGLTSMARVATSGLGIFDGGLRIPTATTLSLNAGATTKLGDVSGDIRVDLATGKALKIYINNTLEYTLDVNELRTATAALNARATSYGHVYMSQTAYGGATYGYQMTANPNDGATAFVMNTHITGTDNPLTSGWIQKWQNDDVDFASINYAGLGTFAGGVTTPLVLTSTVAAGSKAFSASGYLTSNATTEALVVRPFDSSTNTALRLTTSTGATIFEWNTQSDPGLFATQGQSKISGNNTNAGPAIRFYSQTTLTSGTITEWYNAGAEKLAVNYLGKFKIHSAIAGTATLVSGTVTVSSTSVKTGDVIFLSRNTPGGTIGIDLTAPVGSIVDATSFVINSVDAAGAVLVTDTSTVNWWIVDNI